MDAEAAEDLGQLGDIAELVGQIPHGAGLSAELPADAAALQQVADGGLAAGEVQVVLEIPGADDQAALLDVLL